MKNLPTGRKRKPCRWFFFLNQNKEYDHNRGFPDPSSLSAVIPLHVHESTNRTCSKGKDQMTAFDASNTSKISWHFSAARGVMSPLYFFSPAGKKGAAGAVCSFENSSSHLVSGNLPCLFWVRSPVQLFVESLPVTLPLRNQTIYWASQEWIRHSTREKRNPFNKIIIPTWD